MTRKQLREVVELCMLKAILERDESSRVEEPGSRGASDPEDTGENSPDTDEIEADEAAAEEVEVCDIPLQETSDLPPDLEWEGVGTRAKPDKVNGVVEDGSFYRTIAFSGMTFRPGGETAARGHASTRAKRQAILNLKAAMCIPGSLSNPVRETGYAYAGMIDPATGMSIGTDGPGWPRGEVYFLFSVEKESAPSQQPQRTQQNQPRRPREEQPSTPPVQGGGGNRGGTGSSSSTRPQQEPHPTGITTGEEELEVRLGDGSVMFISISDRDNSGKNDIVVRSGDYVWAYSLWHNNSREVSVIKLMVGSQGQVSVTAIATVMRQDVERTEVVENQELSSMKDQLGEEEITLGPVTFRKIEGPDPSVV